MPKKTAKKAVKKSYSVPFLVDISGSIDVEASSPEEAIELAKAEYFRRMDKNGGDSYMALDGRSSDLIVANGDDPDEVEEVG